MLWSWAPQRGSASTLLSSWGAQEARLDASLCTNGEWVADEAERRGWKVGRGRQWRAGGSLGLRGLPVRRQTLRRKHSDPGCRRGGWPEGGCNSQRGPLMCRAADTETQGLPCRAAGALRGRQCFAARSDLPRAGRGPGLPPGRAPRSPGRGQAPPSPAGQHSESPRTIPQTGACAAC